MRCELRWDSRGLWVFGRLFSLGSATLGTRLLMEGGSQYETQGYVFTTLGVLVTAIGAIHYFGKPHAERQLDKAKAENASTASLQWSPTYFVSENSTVIPGMVLAGGF